MTRIFGALLLIAGMAPITFALAVGWLLWNNQKFHSWTVFGSETIGVVILFTLAVLAAAGLGIYLLRKSVRLLVVILLILAAASMAGSAILVEYGFDFLMALIHGARELMK